MSRSRSAAPTSGSRPARRCGGTQLVTALVVLGSLVGGLAAWVSVIAPAEMALHRQAVGEIRTVGAAMSAWIGIQVQLQGSARSFASDPVDVSDFPPISWSDLQALLIPDYLAVLPELDPWGEPYDYRLDAANPLAAHVALIRSAGSDLTFEGDLYKPGEVEILAQDLLWANGEELRRPGAALLDLRQRQVRSEQDTSRLGTAMLSWYTDVVSFAGPAAGEPIDLSLFTPISATELDTLLAPFYIARVAPTDGWGELFDFYLDVGDLRGPQVMAIRSRGRGGIAEGSVYIPGTFAAGEADHDVVWADGVFVRRADDLSQVLFLDDFESADLRHWSAAF